MKKDKKIKNKNTKKNTSKTKWVEDTTTLKRKTMTYAQKNIINIAAENGVILFAEKPIEIGDKIYFMDLVVGDFNIVIEVDGLYHNDTLQQQKDNERTSNLNHALYNVYRITNAEASNDVSCKRFIEDIKKLINGINQNRFQIKIPIHKIKKYSKI